jgi:hypothetical protein
MQRVPALDAAARNPQLDFDAMTLPIALRFARFSVVSRRALFPVSEAAEGSM